MMYKIEKPDLSKISKKEFSDALTGQHKDEVMAFVKPSGDDCDYCKYQNAVKEIK